MKRIFFFFFLLLSLSNRCGAEPITGIHLDYDLKNHTLALTVDHLSRDGREEYVRKIIISKNDKEVLTKYYRIQYRRQYHDDEVLIEAKEGDVLKVKAYASEGGTFTQSLTVKEKKNSNQAADS